MNETVSENPSISTDPGNTNAPISGRRKSKRRKFWLIYCLFLILLGEVGSRLYWRFSDKIPVTQMSKIWHRFYPELRDSGVEDVAVRNDDDIYDVLLLGGSLLHKDFGSIATRLEAQLKESLSRPVKIYNAGNVARTSRDSLIKYQSLSTKRFDLVVVCDGMNELRMNNCPPGMFRNDYSHVAWYFWVKRFQAHAEAPYFVLPYTIEYLTADLLDSAKIDWFVPRHRPSAEWMQYGQYVRTGEPFRENIEKILSIAKERGDKVALMTTANFLPDDYSEEAFKRKFLDYGKHTAPIELWGLPENVRKGLAIHNKILREIAAAHSDVAFVELDGVIPKDAKHFDDCCHLADAGCKIFVDRLVDGLPIRQLQSAQRRHTNPAQ